MTTPVTNTNVPSTTDTTAKTAQAQTGLNTNYQDFLKLLTTELNNQDPTAPMDPTAMVAQLASLSQVEQQINTNNILQQLSASLGASQTANAVSYIGKQIDAPGNQFELSGGQGVLNYMLPANTASATVSVTDSSGKLIFSGPGTTVQGRNSLVWNGMDTSGKQVADGVYNFTLSAKDSGGTALTGASTIVSGTVTSVDTQNGTNTLSLDKISVPLTSVTSTYTPKVTSVGNPTTPTTGSGS